MNKLIAILFFAFTFSACYAQSKHAPQTIIDQDGKKYPVKLLKDGNLWMTANIDTDIPGSFGYEDSVHAATKQYGRVYTWEAATKVCSLLKDGWQLPAKEDWQNLVALYGGIPADSIFNKKAAYKVLLSEGISGFNAVLGGNRDQKGKYARINAHGFYWTITEDINNTAWYANFAKGSQALFMQDGGEKDGGISVRCVKKK
ncbi:MAG: FISUMP domain-containing protein [Chitinophagaceae bacterium]